jgi:hypothetical protein
LVFENVYLVLGRTVSEARRKGAALAKAEARTGGVVEVGEFRGSLKFRGIRKVLWCAANPARRGPSHAAKLHDGMEASYSRFLVSDANALARLSAGKPVNLSYEE